MIRRPEGSCPGGTVQGYRGLAPLPLPDARGRDGRRAQRLAVVLLEHRAPGVGAEARGGGVGLAAGLRRALVRPDDGVLQQRELATQDEEGCEGLVELALVVPVYELERLRVVSGVCRGAAGPRSQRKAAVEREGR